MGRREGGSSLSIYVAELWECSLRVDRRAWSGQIFQRHDWQAGKLGPLSPPEKKGVRINWIQCKVTIHLLFLLDDRVGDHFSIWANHTPVHLGETEGNTQWFGTYNIQLRFSYTETNGRRFWKLNQYKIHAHFNLIENTPTSLWLYPVFIWIWINQPIPWSGLRVICIVNRRGSLWIGQRLLVIVRIIVGDGIFVFLRQSGQQQSLCLFKEGGRNAIFDSAD